MIPRRGADRVGRPVRFFGRPIRPRLGVIQSSIVAAVVLVAAAGLYALVAGDRFDGGDPAATATPLGSMPVGSEPPSSTVAAFLAFVSGPEPSFHVETRTVVTLAEETVTVVSVLDHAGANYAGTIEITTAHRLTRNEVITIPPSSYLREPDGPWRTGDAPKRGLSPFASLSAATAIADLGLENVAGRELRHLRVDLLPVDTTLAPSVKDVVYSATTFDLWVDASGAPVSGTFSLDAMARKDDKPATVTIRSEFTFSRVGEPMDIVAPGG